MKRTKKSGKQTYFVIILLGLSFFANWQSSPVAIRDTSSGSGSGSVVVQISSGASRFQGNQPDFITRLSGIFSTSVSLNLPRWDGRDFSIVPQGRIELPTKELPVGWYPPKIYPLPRDLDRDFDP